MRGVLWDLSLTNLFLVIVRFAIDEVLVFVWLMSLKELALDMKDSFSFSSNPHSLLVCLTSDVCMPPESALNQDCMLFPVSVIVAFFLNSFNLMVNLLLTKLARDHAETFVFFVQTSLCPVHIVKTLGQYSPSMTLALD